VPDLADDGGDAGVAGLAGESDREAQCCHDAGPGAGPYPGGIFTERDIADPVGLVPGRPLAA